MEHNKVIDPPETVVPMPGLLKRMDALNTGKDRINLFASQKFKYPGEYEKGYGGLVKPMWWIPSYVEVRKEYAAQFAGKTITDVAELVGKYGQPAAWYSVHKKYGHLFMNEIEAKAKTYMDGLKALGYPMYLSKYILGMQEFDTTGLYVRISLPHRPWRTAQHAAGIVGNYRQRQFVKPENVEQFACDFKTEFARAYKIPKGFLEAMKEEDERVKK